MKNYNKILEAVNRGILLALDDFDDEEQVLHVKSRLINHRDYTKEYLDLMRDTVDFNLPSGNLWHKYNLDVNPNLLTNPEDWYGGYYAWGETEPKDAYNIYNYKHSKLIHAPRPNVAFDELFTKYCHNTENGYKGYSDNLTQLEPEDDAVHVKLGSNYFIPTANDFRELFNNTVQTLKIDYKGIKGLNGIELVGKEDDLRIFLPFAEYITRIDDVTNSDGISLYLWTSSFNGEKTDMATNIGARKYEFAAGWRIRWTEDIKRVIGLPLRPVYRKN